MNGQIPWWQSKAIWLGLAQALVGIAVGIGWLTAEQGSDTLQWLDGVLGLLITGLGAASIWARTQATKEIKPEVLPAPSRHDPPGMEP